MADVFVLNGELAATKTRGGAVLVDIPELALGIADLSTSSLEAWRFYTAGLDLEQKAMVNEAVAQYAKAVKADPAFIAAYYKLSLYLFSQGERQKGLQYFEKLKALRDRATVKEQYQIDRLDRNIGRVLDNGLQVAVCRNQVF